MTKPWGCTKCKRGFATVDGLYSHCKKKHNRAGMSKEAKAEMAALQGDDESFADRAIQAQLDHAMGVYNFDYEWLVEPYK